MNLKIAILVPGEMWHAGFGHSLSNLIAFFCESTYKGGTKEIVTISMSGSILPQVRTELVMRAIDCEATHALFLDSDMDFQPDMLNKLLRHNLPIVGCNYSRRVMPPFPTCWGLDDAPVVTTKETKGLQEVAHIGTGAMLIDMRLFSHLKDKLGDEAFPWFTFEWRRNEQTGKRYMRGEDVYFCNLVRSAGVPVYVDHDASQDVGHIGKFTFENWHVEQPKKQEAA